MPDPRERMDVEWVREAEEVSVMLVSVSVPVDVIEMRGAEREIESVIVKAPNVSD